MPKPNMLWFDCTSTFRVLEMQRQMREHFNVVTTTRIGDAALEIGRNRPHVLCFDFDFPDRARLRMMQAVKRAYVSLPVLMLTLEHSEALAMWAFRARVWNYLLKPVSTTELQDNLTTLARITMTERRGGRVLALPEQVVPTEIPSRRPDDPQIKLLPTLSFIEQHFNTRCSAEEAANLCGMTRFTFSRLFRSTFGLTFQEYLLRFRIAKACHLLERPATSVTEVGYCVGFNDSSHFSRLFKRCTGMLPSEYINARVRPSAASMHPSVLLANHAAAQKEQDLASETPVLDDLIAEIA